jgi:hypothetical protein
MNNSVDSVWSCYNFLGLVWFYFIVLTATFNNISVISWWSVLFVEETGVPGKNHQPAADKLYHIMLYT